MQSFKGKLNLILLLHLIRIFFGCVFLLSAVMKLIDLNSFMIALGKFKMLNMWQLEILTWFFPVVELFIGLLLIFNIRTNTVSIVATFMLTFFTAVIISKIFEGEEVSCGCFGNLTKDTIDYTTVIRNIILIFLGMAITISHTDEKFKSKIILAPNKNYISHTLINTFLVTVFFFLGVQTIIFGLQNRELKNRVMLLATNKDVLKIGDFVKPFTAVDITQRKIKFSFENKEVKTLAFIFSTNCKPCQQNLSNWKTIVNFIKDQLNLRIIGISLDSIKTTKEYASLNQINFPVYSATNLDFKISFKAFVTPQTLILSPDGQIEKVIVGILDKNKFEEIINGLNKSRN